MAPGVKRIHKILVIDDDVELYEMVAEYPRTRWYQVEAVNEFQRKRYIAPCRANLRWLPLDYMLPSLNDNVPAQRLPINRSSVSRNPLLRESHHLREKLPGVHSKETHTTDCEIFAGFV
jgi:hypothetical protein